jgi:hypothetical protein
VQGKPGSKSGPAVMPKNNDSQRALGQRPSRVQGEVQESLLPSVAAVTERRRNRDGGEG